VVKLKQTRVQIELSGEGKENKGANRVKSNQIRVQIGLNGKGKENKGANWVKWSSQIKQGCKSG